MRLNLVHNAGRLCLLILVILPTAAIPSRAVPKRDHLTPQEADMVRDAQELDKRIGVFVKAADRRLLAVFEANEAKQSQKDIETWGELKGSRADFLYDLAKILDEAITNIDDVSGRDERNPLVPKAILKLAEASSRILTQLAPLRDKLSGEAEHHSYDEAVEYAQSVVDASTKLPPPDTTTKKKDSN